MCALSVAVVSIASAQKFHADKTGALKGKQLGNQVFLTGAGTVTCTTASTSGTVTSLLALHQLVEVKYSGCTAFGFIKTHITPALYLFNADNGLVQLENGVLINPLGAGCEVHLAPQHLLGVAFQNTNKKIVEISKVHSIKSQGTGGVCGGANTTGTYTGNNQIELEGGTIEWF
ncbi:MAG TPA: hypothetical protein VFY36_06355 [Solirubrobacteraceae bacterium]|nr:hypothetical protein [Solirubrobacteraceae bacterium]